MQRQRKKDTYGSIKQKYIESTLFEICMDGSTKNNDAIKK